MSEKQCMLTISPAQDSFDVKGYNILCQSFWLYKTMHELMFTLAELVPRYKYTFELQEKTYTVHCHIIFTVPVDTEAFQNFVNIDLKELSYTYKSPNYPAIQSCRYNKKYKKVLEHKFGFCILLQEGFTDNEDYLSKTTELKSNARLQQELCYTYRALRKSRDYKVKSKARVKRNREVYFEVSFGHGDEPTYSSDIFGYTQGIVNQRPGKYRNVYTPSDIQNNPLN